MTNEQKIKINTSINELVRSAAFCAKGEAGIRNLVETIIGEPLPLKKEWKIGTIVAIPGHNTFVILQSYKNSGEKKYFSAGSDGRVKPFSNEYDHAELDSLIQDPATRIVGHVEWVEDGKP